MHPGIVFCAPQASLRTVAQVQEPLRVAARIMAEHRVMHLIAVEGDPARAVGVLSTLDVAAVMAESRR
jgi:CBS domain-containing protein